MSEKYLFPDRGWYKGKTVRDFCRFSLDNFDEIRINFDYYWFVEGCQQLPYGDSWGGNRDEVFNSFMDYSLVIPEYWDGLPYSIALETVKEFFCLP